MPAIGSKRLSKQFRTSRTTRALLQALSLLVGLLFAVTSVQALDIPFLDQSIPFDIQINEQEAGNTYENLIDVINEGIEEQRDENLTLKNLQEPGKILRFEQDIIRKILRSQGYYRSLLEAEIVAADGDTEPSRPKKEPSAKEKDPSLENTTQASPSKDKIKFIYQITPGRRYTIEELSFTLPGVDQKKLPDLGINKGDPLLADKILTARQRILQAVQRDYCFFEFKLEYEVLLDHQSASASVSYTSATGQPAKFGPIELQGLETVDEAYLRTFIDYQENDCFQRDKIHNARLSVLRSNLIANASIEIDPIKDGKVTTRFILNERHHRTIKAGLGFSTDEGPYISAGWEHRNIQGSGEKLEINSRFSEVRQKVAGDFFIPTFFAENKSLQLYSEALQEDLDAYQALSLKAGAKMGFKRSDSLQYSIGAELKVSDVEDEDTSESFHLLSFPLEAQWDKTNSLLDPTEGFLVNAELRPYVDIINTETRFLKSLLSFSVYHTFEAALQPTIAARYSLGSISGESVVNIPADERFYVGGGGSVRGYPYQSLSRLDGDDPEGGASFQQINTELRIRFLENWGLAMFAGGGYAFEEANPPFDEDLLWGAGFGVRYYTSFAPLRMDIAFPLNRREAIDDSFQLYISIGQAF